MQIKYNIKEVSDNRIRWIDIVQDGIYKDSYNIYWIVKNQMYSRPECLISSQVWYPVTNGRGLVTKVGELSDLVLTLNVNE